MKLLQLFCDVDDFCKEFYPMWNQNMIAHKMAKRIKPSRLHPSEVITIVIHFHQSSYRTFKAYYIEHVKVNLKSQFPKLVSYSRFVELMAEVLIPLCQFLNTRKGKSSGVSYIDSTPIAVCHNKRIYRHKVFDGLAQRGKSSMGWFYGFKLHLIVNDKGELLAFCFTPGNVDDRNPVPQMARDLGGLLFGDKGYISQKLFELLCEKGLKLITTVRKNMKNRLMTAVEKVLLRKRSLIETINDQLKNISQIEHSRHRSVKNFMVNLVAALIAYSYQEKKPSLKLNSNELSQLPIAA